jgi:hypothetical protein
MKHTNQISPAQRRAIKRVIRFYRERNAYTGCTSVRIELNTESRFFVSLVVTTRRSDCEKYSPRQVVCAERAHVFVGKRGGLKVASAEANLRSNVGHVRAMLRAS